MILYRPVSLHELELIYDSGLKAFPARLPQQPIFYPVLDLAYARQTASDWNVKRGQFAGYVTQFKVEDDYIARFEKHGVGHSEYQEFWIPEEEMEEFNRHILGHIKVVEAYFGKKFQGFVPEAFGLQGKDAVEQFTLLANSYVYKRMDFYLEIKRNHKAIFLNYPFWQIHEFKNPGLKSKVIQGIREAWLTSFPQTPLVPPIPENVTPATQDDSTSIGQPLEEDTSSVKQINPKSLVKPPEEKIKPVKPTAPNSWTQITSKETGPVKPKNFPTLVRPNPEDRKPVKQTNKPVQAQPLEKPVHEDLSRSEQAKSQSVADQADEDIKFREQTDAPLQARHLAKPREEDLMPIQPNASRYLMDDFDEDLAPEEQTHSASTVHSVHENIAPIRQTDSQSLLESLEEDRALETQTDSDSWDDPAPEQITSVKQIDSHFAKGVELGLNGQVHEAIDELTRAIETDPDPVVAYTSLGVAFHRLGEEKRALACYEAALKRDPRYAEAHYFRANILYSQGNVREALMGYTRAIGLNPELIEAYQNPSPQDRLTDYSPSPTEMYRIAKPAYRILDLSRSLESNPRQANLLKERAAEFYRLWNYEQAIEDYTASLAIQPDDASALHFRGLAYEQLGHHDRAQADYRRAVTLNSELSDAYIQRGVALGQSGNLRQSIASLTEAIRLAPQNFDAYFHRGVSYFQLGDVENAIDDFSSVIRLLPEDGAAYYWRGISHEEVGRQSEASADYRQFLALSQDENARAEIQQRLDQWNTEARNSVKETPKTKQSSAGKSEQRRDLYDLVAALGERALQATWFASNVNCYGEATDELKAVANQNRPMDGQDFLRITSGIRQTLQGDFQAFDPGTTSPWIFLRAWDGNGFYIETNDPRIEKQLKAQFQVEEVEGASPPYESLFIRI